MARKQPRSRIDAWLHEPTLEDHRLAYRTRKIRGSKKYLAVGAGGTVLGVVMNKSDDEEEQMDSVGRPKALIAKTDGDRRRKAGTAVAAGGGMGVVLGTVASGVPGFKAKPGTSALRRAPAGILGGRYASHTDVTNKYRAKSSGGKGASVTFRASRNAGKVHAEGKVLDELKSGYRLGRKAQIGSAAVLGTGLLLRRGTAGENGDRRGGATAAGVAGGGAATAAGAYGVSSALGRKSGEWAERGKERAKRAEAIVPGSTGEKMSDRGLRRAAGGRGRRRLANIAAAGHAAGDSRQSKYLSYAYGANAKAFRKVGHGAAGIAALGAAIEGKKALEKRRAA